jgi:hypothetical protein
MPTLTDMARTRPDTPPPDLDACKDIVVKWYKSVFGFTDSVATALYDKQLLRDKNTLAELSDNEVDNVIRAIRRTQAVTKLSLVRLKLAIFWIKHQDRTQREIGIPARPLVTIKLDTMLLLKTQKQLEDEWRLGNKGSDYPVQTLDLASATKTFDKTKTISSCVRGVTGVPLSYVIRNILYQPCLGNDPAFGEPESVYSSIDLELILRAPILHLDTNEDDNKEELKAEGPFAITFLTDAKKVWAILHAQYAVSAAWQHVKKYSTTQNGRQVWRTLRTFFFEGDRVSTMHADIISTLKTLFYSSDHKNYTFDKYCTMHVEQHNQLSTLLEFGVQGLDESMKIHYFQEGIKDDSFDSAKTMILVDRSKFQDFNSVMNLIPTSSAPRRMTLSPKAAPFWPFIRDVAVAAEAAAGLAVAADVVVTHMPEGMLPKRKSIR